MAFPASSRHHTRSNATPQAKILVVDDQPTVLKYVALALKKQGFDLILTDNGPECLTIFEQSHHAIDLVLLDVSMPEMSGVEVARRLFEITAHPNVILMTGYTLESVIPSDLQRLCGTLIKPFAAAQLLEAVEKCLKAEK